MEVQQEDNKKAQHIIKALTVKPAEMKSSGRRRDLRISVAALRSDGGSTTSGLEVSLRQIQEQLIFGL